MRLPDRLILSSSAPKAPRRSGRAHGGVYSGPRVGCGRRASSCPSRDFVPRPTDVSVNVSQEHENARKSLGGREWFETNRRGGWCWEEGKKDSAHSNLEPEKPQLYHKFFAVIKFLYHRPWPVLAIYILLSALLKPYICHT